MKTASQYSLLAALSLGLATALVAVGNVHAQTAAQAANAPLATASVAPATAPALTEAQAAVMPVATTTTTVTQPGIVQPTIVNAVVTPATVALPPGSPTGTPAIVGAVIQNLQQTQSNISLEDMTRAQDALARLDLLLSIEKKMGEIKHLQDERNGLSSNGGMGMAGGAFGAPNIGVMPTGGVGAIPASALALPAGAVPSAPVKTSHKKASDDDSAGSGSYTVERISGTNGMLSAVLVTPSGSRKTVRAGDAVGRMKVASISSAGVELRGNKGASKTLGVDGQAVTVSPLLP